MRTRFIHSSLHLLGIAIVALETVVVFDKPLHIVNAVMRTAIGRFPLDEEAGWSGSWPVSVEKISEDVSSIVSSRLPGVRCRLCHAHCNCFKVQTDIGSCGGVACGLYSRKRTGSATDVAG